MLENFIFDYTFFLSTSTVQLSNNKFVNKFIIECTGAEGLSVPGPTTYLKMLQKECLKRSCDETRLCSYLKHLQVSTR